jgi:8-oxo-dGTP pyrophosphatase MutT (NUDIX family)
MTKTRDSTQFAALPCRIAEGGARQVMLVTSRETHRWVIPKGWPMKGLRPPKVAAREAYEEAGLVGRIFGKRPVGVFHYEKFLPKDRLLCEVRVFLLWVDHQLDDWPEKGQRETRWFDPAEAAGLVDEGGLAEIIRQAIVFGAATPGRKKPSAAAPGTKKTGTGAPGTKSNGATSPGSRKHPRKRRLLVQPQPAR